MLLDRKQHVVVAAWDLSHNPAGRAVALAEMISKLPDYTAEVIGPVFPAYGKSIWAPLSECAVKIRSFEARSFEEFIASADKAARETLCDIVYVSKARLPSMIIGALFKRHQNCRLICDVDDYELGFFANQLPASFAELVEGIVRDPASLNQLYGEIFTRYAATLLHECDYVTVASNPLQSKFGGMIVRHGRDEATFDPSLYDREATRREFGYKSSDRILLFLGTVRDHKGLDEVAQALKRVGDERLCLCIIGGIPESDLSGRLQNDHHVRIFESQSWSRVPELVNMADAVFLLQDRKSVVSQFQLPAKLTDAVALGVPVYATPVAPMRELEAAGVLQFVSNGHELDVVLRSIVDDSSGAARRTTKRQYFLGELSYSVNAARIKVAFESACSSPRGATPAFDELFKLMQALYPPLQDSRRLTGGGRSWRRPVTWSAKKPDLVFLWKQNDSDIYGRRADMVCKYLLQSGQVGKIIHFDAPLSSIELERHVSHEANEPAHQGRRIYVNTIKRVLRQSDTAQFKRLTYLHRSGPHPERMAGIDLPTRDEYGEFIRKSLRAEKLSMEAILYICPVVFDYRLFIDEMKPGCIIGDVIDDQRRFSGSSEYRARLALSYKQVLSDVDFAITNCSAVRDAFDATRAGIVVVPNGAESFEDVSHGAPPEELVRLPRPILGYVGNLRDRLDIELIAKVAMAFPQGSIVLIGSAHDRSEIIAKLRFSNVHFLGVKEYPGVVDYIRQFDVALVPHERNDVSDAMNPLKAYVYLASGAPVVATDIANLEEVKPYISVARSHDGFIKCIEREIDGSAVRMTAAQRIEVINRLHWRGRVLQILELLKANE